MIGCVYCMSVFRLKGFLLFILFVCLLRFVNCFDVGWGFRFR